MASKIEVPPLVYSSVARSYENARSNGIALSRAIARLHKTVFDEYQVILEGYFSKDFSEPLPSAKIVVWSPSASRRKGALKTLMAPFNELVENYGDIVIEMMDDYLSMTLSDSIEYSLWALYQSGIDVSKHKHTQKSLIRSIRESGVEGHSYVARAKTAISVAKTRQAKWLRLSIASGFTLRDTLLGYEGMSRSLQNRLSLLGENETHRSFLLGTELGAEDHKSDLRGLLWLSRKTTSCNVCKGKHMQLTSLTPVEDSHPGCRCMKVPIPKIYQERSVGFTAFSALQ